MLTAAALCWYDEPPELLERCVRSLAGLIDVLVAVDGPYALWERQVPRSSRREYQAIRSAAAEAGLRLLLLPPLPRPRQVEKRSRAIQAAAAEADWVMPLDSDWTLSGDPAEFRAALEQAEGDAGLVSFFTPGQAPADVSSWHAVTAGGTVLYPFVYRSLPGLRVERAHWLYTAVRDGVRVSLWPSDFYPHAELFQVPLTITHHCLTRDPRKFAENQRYVATRDAQYVGGVEP